MTFICMQGSPLSRINNLDLWQTHDYKALGIAGEPYLDVDFTNVFYLTDTGRRWNHAGAGIRDRVESVKWGGQACFIVVIGGLGIGCYLGC